MTLVVFRMRTAVAITLLLAAAACGGSSAKTSDAHPAQPTRNGAFVPGNLDSLPLLPRMRSLSPQTRVRGVTTESYRLSGYSARAALVSYAELLNGWSLRVAPHPVGESYRGIWARNGSNLLVTAVPDSTLTEGGDTHELEMTLQVFSPGTTPPTDPPG